MSTHMQAAHTAPDLPRKAVAGTLIGACSAVFVAQASSSIPSTLNGLFVAQLGATGSHLTWITAAFMIAVVVFEFTFGVLGDLFGRKKLVVAGAGVLLLGLIVCATAPVPIMIVVGSALNGLGAGAMLPGSLSLAAAVTHTPASRARAVATWAGFLSAGGGAAPLLGGLFGTYGSWRGAYWVLVALTALSILLTLFLATESSAPEGRKMDVPGQVTFAVGLILVLVATVQGPEVGWGTPWIWVLFVIGAVFLVAFVFIESRVESPILHLDLFRNRAFAVSSIVAIFGMFAFLGGGYAISMWMGPIQHQDALRIAAVFIVLQLPTFLLIPVMSRVTTRVRPVWLLSGGFVLMSAGYFLLTGLNIHDPALVAFLVPALLIGAGFGLALNSVTAVALNSVPRHLAGMASATINMIRDLGFCLGPVVVGAVALSTAGNTLMALLAGSGLPAGEIVAATEAAGHGGAIAVNSLPPGTPGAGAHGLALEALNAGFTQGFVVAGVATAIAAVITLIGMGRAKAATMGEPATSDPQHAAPDAVPALYQR